MEMIHDRDLTNLFLIEHATHATHATGHHQNSINREILLNEAL